MINGRDTHLTLLIELKEAVARIEQKVESSSRDVSLGVEAHSRVSKLEAKLGTIWTVVLALPVIGAALAFFLPEHYSNVMPNQHQQ